MKIFLFTNFTPTKDNYNGPSAMMYHLFKNRPTDCQVLIFSTNWNHVPSALISDSCKALGTDIHILKDTIFNFFHRRETLQELRIKLGIDSYYNISNYRLSKQALKEIETFNPDFVWVYGEAHTSVIKQLSKYRLLVAGFDCFALHYNRLMRDLYCFEKSNRFRKILQDYKIALVREIALKDIPCKYYDVGIEDRNMFEIVTGRSDAAFYPHPHYDVLQKEICFTNEKLSILISGKLDQYTWSDSYRLVDALCKSARSLANKFRITFLGKGWVELQKKLEASGFDVKYKRWVEIYADEVVKHEIQLFPISVGSGTKGKVLDALSMGLLCIGSKIAMENIYVKHRHSCYVYKQVSEIVPILLEVYSDRKRATQIAINGQEQVLKWHSPQRIFSIICQDVLGEIDYNGVEEFNEVTGNLQTLLL